MKYHVLFPLLVAPIACSTPEVEAGSTPRQVRGIEVAVTEIPSVLTLSGTARATRTAEIATRLMARVTDIRVDVGDRVRTGQLLAILGGDDLAAARAQAEAGVAAAGAARDEAARNLERMESLLEQDAVPLVQRDAARLRSVQAESGYRMAVAALNELESQERYGLLRAPFSGRVVRRNIDPGDLANPGVPLFVLEDDSREAVVHIPLAEAAGISAGAPVTVRFTDGSEIATRIERLASGADAATRTLEARTSLPAWVPTGTELTFLIPLATHEGVAVLETDIVRRGQLTGVQTPSAEGVRIRWVRLGRAFTAADSLRYVEVLSGLNAGDQIVR